MNLQRVTSTTHPMFLTALELYKASFPRQEQRETLSQKKILCESEYHFDLVYDRDIFVGLVLYWETENMIYIEHFCILPEERNKKYGQKVLTLLKEKQKECILEIDPPIDDLSKRRKSFYERCGFVENSYQHIHPPYHRIDSGHKLILMTHPEQLSREKYDAFHKYLIDRVMNQAF